MAERYSRAAPVLMGAGAGGAGRARSGEPPGTSKVFLGFVKDSLGTAKDFLGICKLFFGGFVCFQEVARDPNRKRIFPNFCGPPLRKKWPDREIPEPVVE
jgi:hypothetical protein